MYYIMDKNNRRITGTTVEGVTVVNGDTKKIQYQFKIAHPKLWDLEDPYCYKLVTLVKQNDIVVDSTCTVFGIRTIVIDAAKGFGNPLYDGFSGDVAYVFGKFVLGAGLLHGLGAHSA